MKILPKDVFIEIFGRGEFETLYSLSREAGHHYKASADEFAHLSGQEDLMYQYADFFSKQPLIKKITVNVQKYVIVHGWYEPSPDTVGENIPEQNIQDAAFRNRYCLLWERDVTEYSQINKEYTPIEGEKLIHGHSPTLGAKKEIHRWCSPGKVWVMGESINVDCGMVYKIIDRCAEGVEYANLAAYDLENQKAEYLWDIVDEYALNDDEYYEDKKEREEREALEQQKQRERAIKRSMPYLLSFYKQVFDLEQLPSENDYTRCGRFNFLNDWMRTSLRLEHRQAGNYDFDFEKEPLIATAYSFKDRHYLLSVSHYEREFAEVIVRPLCDFYDPHGDKELFTLKMIKNTGDAFHVRVLDSQHNILGEIRQSYY